MLAAVALAATSYGQGTVVFANSTTTLIQTNGVSLVAAAGAKVELLWAPVGVTALDQFQLLPGAVTVGSPLAGRFSGGNRTVPVGNGVDGIAAGSIANFVVRGYIGLDWTTRSWEGFSSVFTLDTGDPTTVPAGTPTAITSAGGWTGNMNLTIVPEPSSMALAGLGAASLLIFRRRK